MVRKITMGKYCWPFSGNAQIRIKILKLITILINANIWRCDKKFKSAIKLVEGVPWLARISFQPHKNLQLWRNAKSSSCHHT